MSGKQRDATRMLEHYLSMAWQRAGLKWTSDNSAEVEAIVDAIVAAARETEQEINVAKI